MFEVLKRKSCKNCEDKNGQIKRMQETLCRLSEHNLTLQKLYDEVQREAKRHEELGDRLAAELNALRGKHMNMAVEYEGILKEENERLLKKNSQLVCSFSGKEYELSHLKRQKDAEINKLTRQLEEEKKKRLPKEMFEKISHDNLLARVSAFLKKERIQRYYDLSKWSEEEILRCNQVGRKTLGEIKAHILKIFPDYVEDFNFIKIQERK